MSRRTVPPSLEVSEEARRRAERLAVGLFPHQVEGVAFLLGRRRSILADDMGLGKTRQSIIALGEAAPAGPWLVVCPASVKRNWAREIQLAKPGSEVCVVEKEVAPARGYTGWVVVNYDILGRTMAALRALPWAGIVFDEAHYVRNHTSQRSRFGRQLVDGSGPDTVIHALTGTPLTNRPRDLFPLLQLVQHPMARSFLSFAKRYCAAYQNDYGWVTTGASNLEELRTELHGTMLRRTKDEVLALPPKVRTWLEQDVPEGTGRHEARDALRILLGGERGVDQRRALLATLSTARRKIAVAKTARTIEFLDGVVAQDEKVLVFSCFDEPLRKIHEHFGAGSLLLTGATPAARRQQLVDRFQNDADVRVLAANIIAGGIGLNLTVARQVVFNDLDWVPANHWQAEDRAYRIGQTGTVNVTYLVAGGTLDEFVARTLAFKSSLIDVVVEGGAAARVPGDVFAELESLVAQFDPGLADSASADPAEDPVDRLLREVSTSFRARLAAAAGNGASGGNGRGPASLSPEAIEVLAKVLAGPAAKRYRVTSHSRPGVSYILELDGPDLVCSCPGFEYRGACSHARELRAALKQGVVPSGFELEA